MTAFHPGPPAAGLLLAAVLYASVRAAGRPGVARGVGRQAPRTATAPRAGAAPRTGAALRTGAMPATGTAGRARRAAPVPSARASGFATRMATRVTRGATWAARAGTGPPGVDRRGARWARPRDVAALLCGAAEPGRLVLGTVYGRARGPRSGRRRRRAGALLAAERSQSVAVVGPTQSGKTTSLAVPAILGWEGPVLATSVKTDLVRDTLAWRRRCGLVRCFDPTGATGLVADQWSPVQTAGSWSSARRTAADLTEAARGEGTTADGDFWYSTAAKLLAPLLFAAAHGGLGMADVVRWVDTHEVDEVLTLLEGAGVPEALDAARATWLRDDRQRSAVYTTAETVLQGFADLPAGAAGTAAGGAGGGVIRSGELLAGANTLYVCAPAHDQRRLRGLFTAVVKHVLDEAFTRAARAGGRLDPPLLVVLDEAANIAPLGDLDGLAATCAGHGIQLVTIWQDLAQITARYGARAATVVNNHRAKVFLSGIADPGTLEHASQLVGDEELLVGSVTRDPTGARSTTTAPHQRRLLPSDALRCLPTGTGALVYGSLPPVHLALRPWWEDPVLAERAGGAGRAGP